MQASFVFLFCAVFSSHVAAKDFCEGGDTCDVDNTNLLQSNVRAQAKAIDPSIQPSSLNSSTWCPSCSGELCNRKFLFLVSTGGRTGSTTTMNMINQIPHIFIYGENGMMFDRFLPVPPLGNVMRYTPGENGPILLPDNPHQLYLKSTQGFMWDFLEPPLLSNRLVEVRGFKDIRWTSENLQHILQACPCSRVILNHRSSESQKKSMLHAFGSKRGKKAMPRLDELPGIRTLLKNSNVPTFDLATEIFLTQEFNKLAKWLGANCLFTGLMHSNANGGYKSATKGEEISCKSP